MHRRPEPVRRCRGLQLRRRTATERGAGGADPLGEDGAAALQGGRSGGLGQEGQRGGVAGQPQDGVHVVHEQLVEQLEMSHGRAVVEADLVAGRPGLRVQLQQRVAAEPGEDGGGEQGEEAVREDREGRKTPFRGLASPEQAVAPPGKRLDRPRAGHVGLVAGNRLVPLVELVQELAGEGVAGGGRGGGLRCCELVRQAKPGRGEVQEPETPRRDPAGTQSSTAKGGLQPEASLASRCNAPGEA
jgi:hypothetical protein